MPAIRINNVNLYYERNGSGTPLVMLHGLGSLGADWQLQIPFFSNDYDVITPDLRGHGRSEKKAHDYEIATLAEDVAALLDALKIPAAHIVGLSLGSFVALQLALTRPEKVLSLTLSGTCSRIRNIGRFHLALRALLIRLLPMALVAKIVAASCFPKSEHREFRALCQMRIGQMLKSDYMALFEAIRGFDVYERLKEIRCPLLLVVGGEDSLTPVSESQKVHEMIPHSHLEIIEEAGHVLPIERAAAFNQLLAKFLAMV